MADYDDLVKDFEELKHSVTCAICKEVLTEPKLLPICGHDFCLACIQKWTQSRRSQGLPVNCPTCRESINAPGGDMAKLQSSLHLRSVISMYNSSTLKKRIDEIKNAKEKMTNINDDLKEMIDRCKTSIEETDKKMQTIDEDIKLAQNEVRRHTELQINILKRHENSKLDHLEAIRTRHKTEYEEMKSKISDHEQEILGLKRECQEFTDMNFNNFKGNNFQHLLDACKTTIERTKSTLSTFQAQWNPPIHYIPNSEVIDVLKNLHVGEIQESIGPDRNGHARTAYITFTRK